MAAAVHAVFVPRIDAMTKWNASASSGERNVDVPAEYQVP
jgi:hypothetical protein